MALVVGIQHLRDGIEPQAVLTADMSVVGIVGIAEEADADIFPLNTAVEVRTNDTSLRTALGADGTLPDALAAISAQLTSVGSAKCVVVRVAEGVDAAATIANIVGNEATETGVWALLSAPENLGLTPRLLIAPGYTSQTVTGVGSVTIGNAGSGYEVGDTISGSGGGGTGFAATVASVDGNGAILTINISNAGSGYTSAPTLSVTSDAGTGATLTAVLAQQANAVCAIMPTICDRLKAVFLPEGPTNTRQAALDWLETLSPSHRTLHPLRQDAKVMDADGDIVAKPLSPYVIGAYISRDAGTAGVPTRSAANQPLYGLVGVTPVIPFSIIDGNSLGQSDLEASFGIVFRGDVGADGALTDGGYVFWGTDTLSADSQWLFANVCRMRDYIEIMQVKALRNYLGRYNLTLQTVQAVINTMESQLVRLRADGYILDFRIGIDMAANTPEELRLGHIDLQFQAEEPPVLRKITLRSRRHREALANLVRSIAVALGSEIAA
jgi:uncharacterized protein